MTKILISKVTRESIVTDLLENHNLYFVGGVVRDEILGRTSLDTDYCYEGNAIEFAQKSGLNIVKINSEFGTVRVDEGGKSVDIASTRTEYYPKKGHLPKIKTIGCPLKEDLKRRDFTINAIAKRSTDNEIIDYYNGLKDIETQKLRVLHKDSFSDDPTRIIRGLKFSVRFGFELEGNTKKLQDEYLDNVNYDMSYHRIKKELTETFGLNIPKAFDMFIEQKIYRLLGDNIRVPNIKGIDICKLAEKRGIKDNIWFIYAAMFIDADTTQLPLTRQEKKILSWVRRLEKESPANNTPIESIVLMELMNYAR